MRLTRLRQSGYCPRFPLESGEVFETKYTTSVSGIGLSGEKTQRFYPTNTRQSKKLAKRDFSHVEKIEGIGKRKWYGLDSNFRKGFLEGESTRINYSSETKILS